MSKDQIRIFLTDDGNIVGGSPLPLGPGEKPPVDKIEDYFQGYANQGIDAVSFDFCGGQMSSFPSKVADPHPGEAHQFMDAGIDVGKIMEKTLHDAGVQFWAGVRMGASLIYRSKFHEKHADWLMTEQHWWGFFRPMLNYELPEVRAYMMDIFREVVENYDTDGLLLNFLRYSPLFHPDRDLQCAGLLTDYISEIRAMLDDVGKAKGKRLGFAVQVCARPNDGRRHGHNVEDWIKQGTVDYVMPTRANNTDLGMPVDLWVEMAEGTDCRILPTVHSRISYPWESHTLQTRDTLRTAAHVFYGQGAHGISGMNLMCISQEVIEGWFHWLRDPQACAPLPHHHRYAMKANNSEEGILRMPILNFNTDDLPPNSGIVQKWYNTLAVRIVDDPATFESTNVHVTIETEQPGARLQILVNGTPAPTPTWPGHRLGYKYEPMATDDFYFVDYSVPPDLFVKGVNQIGFQSLDGEDAHGHAPPPGSMTVREVALMVR